MALNNGAKLVLFIDGERISTLQSVSIKSDSGKVRIDSLDGLAGTSVGSGSITITGKCWVPIGGQEVDVFSESGQNSGFHDLQLGVGNGAYKSSGWFQDSEITQSENGNVEMSFTWMGQSAPLE